jgi:hypothetical protein
VLDWNAASNHSERSRWLSDGIHLTATGQAEFARWLRAELVGLATSHRLVPPKKLEIPVVGRTLDRPDGTTTTIPSSVAAVALNVTGVESSAPGYATVWPCGTSRPRASHLNYFYPSPVANNVIAPVGPNGTVCIYSLRSTEVVVDIAGWFPSAANGRFNATQPLRLVDTRDGTGGRTGRISPQTPLRIDLAGRRVVRTNGTAATVPADAEAVALNVTSTAPVSNGFLTVWPCKEERPWASTVNSRFGRSVPNGVIAPLDSDGSVCLYANRDMHVVVDLSGWFDGGGDAGGYVGTVPSRLLDSRDGTGGRQGRITAGSPIRIPIRGRALERDGATVRVPSGATAAFVNVTAVDGTDPGYVTVWPCGPRPHASNLNYRPGTTIANGVIAPIGPDGSICLYVRSPVHLVVDIAGWFGGGASPAFVAGTPLRIVDTRENLGPVPS